MSESRSRFLFLLLSTILAVDEVIKQHRFNGQEIVINDENGLAIEV